jgi:hypothetical protein
VSRRPIARPALAAVAVAGLVGALSGTPAAGAGAPEGAVFAVNPVQSSGTRTSSPTRTRRPRCRPRVQAVALTNLDGSGYLRGDWANVVTETANRCRPRPDTSSPARRQYEQVMAYYWSPQAQTLPAEASDSARGPPPAQVSLASGQQGVAGRKINQYGRRQLLLLDKHDLLRFGRAASTTPRTARSSCTSTATPVHDAQVPASARRWTPARSARRSATTWPSRSGSWARRQNGWAVQTRRPASPTGTRSPTPRRCRTACAGRRTKTFADVEGEVHADGRDLVARAVGHPDRAR